MKYIESIRNFRISRLQNPAIDRAILAVTLPVLIAASQSNATTSVWTNTDANNSYSDANNWSPAGVPNGNTFDIVIGTPSPTNLDITASVDDMTVNSGGIFNINGNNNFQITGTSVINNGQIVIDNNQFYGSTLTFGNTTVSGTGTILLDSTSATISTAASTEATFGTGQTVQGLGAINATAINHGTVDANITGGTLYIDGATVDGSGFSFTNTGLLEATTGTLAITNSAVVNNAGGVILANTGSVYVNNANVSGGTFTSINSGAIFLDNVTLTGGPTVSSGTTVNVEGNTTTTITGATFTDNGHIVVNENQYYSASIVFNSNTTLMGSGILSLDSSNGSAVLSTGTGDELTQVSTHTIDGFGTINATMINHGTINADVAGQTLFISSAATDGSGFSLTNTGTIEATTGPVQINNGAAINNAGGTIFATGSNVGIYSSNISGGTLTSSGAGQFYVDNCTITGNPTLSTGSTMNLEGNTTTTFTGSTFTNNGLIVINQNQYYSTNLNIASNLTINGTGTINLDSGGAGAQITTGTGDTLTLSSGQTVIGYGQIGASLINNGTINANVTSQALTLTTSNMNNNNVMKATAGAGLSIANITITQTAAGVIEAIGDSGGATPVASTVTINQSTINGGTLTGTGAGTIYVANSTLQASPTISAGTTVNLDGNTNLTLAGPTLTDNGHIFVNFNQYYTSNVVIADNLTLAGTGLLTLDASGTGAQITSNTGDALTQAATHTIDGYGQIGAVFTNNGTVNADVTSQAITLAVNNMTNNSLIEATNGGSLNVTSIAVTQSANGLIEATGNAGSVYSSITLNAATISGGTLAGSATDTISSINSTLTGPLTIASGTLVNVVGNTTTTLTGPTITDNGHIVVNSNQYYSSTLSINDNTTVTGTGLITLNSGGSSALISSGTGFTFSQGASHSIDGFGQINATFINNGTVNADVNAQSINVAGTATNNGTFRASSGGTLNVNLGSLTNLTGSTLAGGTYEVDSNSTMTLNSAGVTTLAAKVLLNGTGTTFNDLLPLATINSNGIFDLENSASFTTTGSLSNSGIIRLGNGTTLNLTGNLTQIALGILEGDGTLDPASFTLFGTVEPGAGEPTGTLTLDGPTLLEPTTDLLYSLGSPFQLSTNSMLDVNGDLTLDGILNVTDSGGFSAGIYDLINFTGTLTNNTLDIGSLPPGYAGTIQIVPNIPGSTTGNVDLVVVGVPEPTSLAVLTVATFSVLSRRRRRIGSPA